MKFKITILLTIISLTSCDIDKGYIDGKVKEVRDELEETRNTFANAVDLATKAVPGERYLRLIDQVHGGNPEEKKKAQELIKSLFKVDPEQKYEVTVWINYNDDAPIEVAVFQSPLFTIHEVEIRNEISSLNLMDVSNASLRKLQLEEIERELSVGFVDVIDEIVGKPTGKIKKAGINGAKEISPISNKSLSGVLNNNWQSIDYNNIQAISGVGNLYSIFHSPKNYRYIDYSTKISPQFGLLEPYRDYKEQFNSQFDNKIKSIKEERKLLADKMANISTLPFKEYSIPNEPNTYVFDWNHLLGGSFLYVVINKNDFDKIKDKDFEVNAIVHEKGNTSKALYSKYKIKRDKDHFNPEINKPVKLKFKNEQVVWSAFDMTNNATVDLKKYDQFAKYVEEISNKISD